MLGFVIHSDPPRAGDAGPLDELIARAGIAPAAQSRRVLPYHEAKRQLASSTGAEAHREEIEFSKPEFFRRPLPGPGVAFLLAHLTLACPPGQTRQLSLTPWGGAYDRVSSDRTAFAHRDELFLLEHVVRVGANVTTKAQLQARAWLRRSWAAVHPFASGRVYPNFPDTELTDWAHDYHGSNIDRFVEAKRRYDPDCVFRFRQSLASLIHRPR
ncbi:MAG: BBE domain-containing protein [Geodermatophilaceae bacterium]